MEELNLGFTGPAQSDYLYHFTGRNGDHPDTVPDEICKMSAEQRLARILQEERFQAFEPFGAREKCVCFSESTEAHLRYLIEVGRFKPWGVVGRRSALLRLGGGAVAYVPDRIHAQFKSAGLGHWAVRTSSDSTWLHEREWRLPLPKGSIGISSLQAILVGDPDWRPSFVTSWVDGSTGEPLPQPDDNPYAEEVTDLPRLWRESWIWVWDQQRGLVKNSPGVLC
ncbi:hypothetical protein E1265_25865 [Streptomyces sp. 8K308]|uniref:hypothetical protein n=1 Tax=Streptomyces sp. 8K308 TaxID=2530388 RepID=UPI00104E9D75|nr:hypothetical protein [Streptomyces sp. 8K308]TDC17912.1 hypothetical protein E1265_25865 [Streptomyces sp. 8K308]